MRGRRSKEKGKGIWALDRAQGRREERHAWPQFLKKMDSAIQGINLYPRDSAIGFPNTFPLNSDLSVNSAGRRRFGISKVALCSWEDGKAKEKVFKNSTRQFRVNRAKILNRSGYVRCPEYLA